MPVSSALEGNFPLAPTILNCSVLYYRGDSSPRVTLLATSPQKSRLEGASPRGSISATFGDVYIDNGCSLTKNLCRLADGTDFDLMAPEAHTPMLHEFSFRFHSILPTILSVSYTLGDGGEVGEVARGFWAAEVIPMRSCPGG